MYFHPAFAAKFSKNKLLVARAASTRPQAAVAPNYSTRPVDFKAPLLR
jgi:hypothetical protein